MADISDLPAPTKRTSVNISDLPSDLIDLTNINMLEEKETNQSVTLKSTSTCSSRSSYTDCDDINYCDDCDDCGEIENLDSGEFIIFSVSDDLTSGILNEKHNPKLKKVFTVNSSI